MWSSTSTVGSTDTPATTVRARSGREDTAIVESIISLGHSCELEVVAEGIETVWQLRQLIQLGCDYGQGYLWSRPVDAAGAESMLQGNFEVTDAGPEDAVALVPSSKGRIGERHQ